MRMENLRKESINVYTDGSSKDNPREGGFGIVYVVEDDDGHLQTVDEDIVRPGFAGASNQQMEMWAAIVSLKELASKQYPPVEIARYRRITILTDSNYLLTHVESARRAWQHNGWILRDGRPVSNSRLWEILIEAIHRAPHRVYFEKVKAHSGHEYNDLADRQAKASRLKQSGQRLPGSAVVRRKRSTKKVKEGSIPRKGQIDLIHVVTAYDEMANSAKFKIEIVDEESREWEAVDFAFTSVDFGLRATHVYRVEFDSGTDALWIIDVFEEVSREDVFDAASDDS